MLMFITHTWTDKCPLNRPGTFKSQSWSQEVKWERSAEVVLIEVNSTVQNDLLSVVRRKLELDNVALGRESACKQQKNKQKTKNKKKKQ